MSSTHPSPRAVHLTRRASKPCPSGHVFDALHLSTTSPPAEHRKSAHLGMFRCSASVDRPEHRNHAHLGTFSMLGVCPPLPHPRASDNCPDGHGFDARRLSTVPNIETVPIWARFRCSPSIHHLPASKTCPDGHVFDARRLSTIPNIETVPIWARCRCSVSIHHLPTRRASKKCPAEHVFDARGVHYFPIPRTSKPCPSGHGFDARRASTTSLPAEHRKNAQMGTFSMLGTSPSPEHRNHAHLDTVSMFGARPPHPYLPPTPMPLPHVSSETEGVVSFQQPITTPPSLEK